jgi:cytochrome P450
MEMRVVLRRILERTEVLPAKQDPDKVEFRAITLAPRDGVLVIQPRPPVLSERGGSTGAQPLATPV